MRRCGDVDVGFDGICIQSLLELGVYFWGLSKLMDLMDRDGQGWIGMRIDYIQHSKTEVVLLN